MDPVPPEYTATRLALHRVATHVLARARHDRSGRFGLRVLAGGFGTPPFGEDESVVRISGSWLVRERRVDGLPITAAMALAGATLDELAAFAGVSLSDGFSVGHDTPPLGNPGEPLPIEGAAVEALGAWLDAGAAAVDHAVAGLGSAGEATILQLWPEHFDVGLDVSTPAGRCNLGLSVGDSFSEEPYAYVGPWDTVRPGRGAYWNAPSGAIATAGTVGATADVSATLVAFFGEGLGLMGVSR